MRMVLIFGVAGVFGSCWLPCATVSSDVLAWACMAMDMKPQQRNMSWVIFNRLDQPFAPSVSSVIIIPRKLSVGIKAGDN
jgi:hypothetical protein